MLPLLLGLLVFIGIHLLPAQPELRRGLVTRYGEGAYKGFYSLVSAIGLGLIIFGYNKAQTHLGKNLQVWSPPAWGRHVTMLLMLPVFPLLIAAYLPGRIAAAVRHPMITAVKFWAAGHLLVRGDVASLLLFGGLLAWAIFDRISLKRREAAGLAKVKAGPPVNDIVAVVAGLLIYGVMLKWGHEALIGVKLIP